MALVLENVNLDVEGKRILNGISHRFDEGKIHIILGNNGVGKTSLAKVIMGFEEYRGYEGNIRLDGVSLDSLGLAERVEKGLSMVPQHIPPVPVRVRDIFDFESVEDIGQFMKKLGLRKEVMNMRLDELMPGDRKRLDMILTMLKPRKYVIIDEPDQDLDTMSADFFREMFDFLRTKGCTLIVITHREEIALMGDEAGLMCAGMMVRRGTPEEVCAYYKMICDICDHINEPEEVEG